MSVVYHIDRTCLLSKNQTISPIKNYNLEDIFDTYNNCFSSHGIQYLARNSNNNIGSLLWELAIEYVRLLKYPQYPSRFNCLFAVENLEQLKSWKHLFDASAHNIVKIECDKFHKFDARWITNPGDFYSFKKTNKFDNISFASYCFFADKYWSGKPSSSPLWELLVELPCKCLELIEY